MSLQYIRTWNFLCFADSECWIKLVLPPFLSISQYRHLNCSLSKYCAQSPTRSPLESFSPNHPVCQFINLLALLADILPESLAQRQPLKSKIFYPMPESMSNAYILNEHHIHNTENPKAMHTLIIFHSNIILLMHWFVFPNNHNL